MHNFIVAGSILLMTKYVNVYSSLFYSFIITSFCSVYNRQILVLLYPQMPSVKIKFLWDHRNVSSLHQELSLCWLLVDGTSVYTTLAWVLDSGCWCLTQHSLSMLGCCYILFPVFVHIRMEPMVMGGLATVLFFYDSSCQHLHSRFRSPQAEPQ